MSKIYTKGGDKGGTSLYDQIRVSKDDIRVESYGTVDELGAALGVAKNFVEDEPMRETITTIQHKLFTVASNLATQDQSKIPTQICEKDILDLEKLIDKYMDAVERKNCFIVNGSGTRSAFLHVARTVCRRAERRAVSLAAIADVDPLVIKYLNRLSDAIYAMARFNEDSEECVVYDK
ncbi:MAG: cob(I)yrinic acid a,c-diamide adenosyltransferase [Tissierellia bacterium]|jgi:cob(I)alamin adenosyltransferase|nr:cob(I)yrinic acid a,c-diamide adenosyltransferase [Tissierellia bacterium]